MNILTMGEAMVLFASNEVGDLEDVQTFTKYVAGAEMNVAIGLSRLSLNSYYVTTLGEDAFGRYISRTLKKEGIKQDYVIYDNKNDTGFMLKEKALHGKDPKVHYYRKNSAASKSSKENLNINFDKIDHVHLSGVYLAVNENTREKVFFVANEAKKRGITITFDPNLRPLVWNNDEKMKKYTNEIAFISDFFMPGIKEAQILTGLTEPDEIAEFYHQKGVNCIIIKMGEKGALAFKKGEPKINSRGFKIKNIVDTVGAGDGFATGIVYSIVKGLSLEEALLNANAIGALQLTCASDNEKLPTEEELSNFKNNNSSL